MPPRKKYRPDQEPLFAQHNPDISWQQIEERSAAAATAMVGNLGAVALDMPLELGKDSKRDRFINKFSWIPLHKREVTIGLQTLPIAVGNAAKSKGSSVQAVDQVMREVTRYRTESAIAREELEAALISSKDSEPLPDAIRSNTAVLQRLAEFLAAKHFLDNFDWSLRRKAEGKTNPDYSAMLQGFISQLSNPQMIDDTKLVELWKQAHASQEARQIYWNNQHDLVKRKGIVEAATKRR